MEGRTREKRAELAFCGSKQATGRADAVIV